MATDQNGKYVVLPMEDVRDVDINRHFSWLAYYLRSPGSHRHLLEGAPDEVRASLNTKAGRAINQLDAATLEQMRLGEALDSENDVVRDGPTRISSLVKSYFQSSFDDQRERGHVAFPSPFRVVLDFLTIPEHPGSRAYALLTMRTLLFEEFRLQPEGPLVDSSGDWKILTKSDFESAFHAISTSFAARYRSKGFDPLESAKGASTVFTREFLAMLGFVHPRFSRSGSGGGTAIDDNITANAKALLDYANAPKIDLQNTRYQYARPKYLTSLPEVGEVFNTIWGLPLPLRGADTIFRGGLLSSAKTGGLVCAIHGGPGSGKTSLALGLGAVLAGMGVATVYLTVEESREDLVRRVSGLIPDQIARLPFVPNNADDWLIYRGPKEMQSDLVDAAEAADDAAHHSIAPNRYARTLSQLKRIREAIQEQERGPGVVLPCSTVVVIDGLHEIASKEVFGVNGGPTDSESEPTSRTARKAKDLYELVEQCRDIGALVVLTAGVDWDADRSLDYLVDVSIRLSHETRDVVWSKPVRHLSLVKARHQLCSPGTHTMQIAGLKGLRFTPQASYQLDRLGVWATKLPSTHAYRNVLQIAGNWVASSSDRQLRELKNLRYAQSSENGVRLNNGSSIFINGHGSSGKAGLALKIAVSPVFEDKPQQLGGRRIHCDERVLVVSFLYPKEYYENLHNRISVIREYEYEEFLKGHEKVDLKSRIEVIQLYPGTIRPDELFGKIEWELRSAKLLGDPYTGVVIDGLHNVFIQFPEIEKHELIWPQLFNYLRTLDVTLVLTHTFLAVSAPAATEYTRGSETSAAGNGGGRRGDERNFILIDDRRSDPLRHALVLKVDFRLEVVARPGTLGPEGCFEVKALSAFGQPMLEKAKDVYWYREQQVFLKDAQGLLV